MFPINLGTLFGGRWDSKDHVRPPAWPAVYVDTAAVRFYRQPAEIEPEAAAFARIRLLPVHPIVFFKDFLDMLRRYADSGVHDFKVEIPGGVSGAYTYLPASTGIGDTGSRFCFSFLSTPAFSIEALYSPRRAARLQLAR